MLTTQPSILNGINVKHAQGSPSSVTRQLTCARAQARNYTLSSKAAVSSWDDSRRPTSTLPQSTVPVKPSGAPRKANVKMMGNKSTGGIFLPLVVLVRNIMGEEEFNKLRGKGISLHSEAIKYFGKIFGVEGKQVQGLIRLAKKNGEQLGFLA